MHDPVTSILWRLRWVWMAIIAVGVASSIWGGLVALPAAAGEPRYSWLDWTSVVTGVGAVAMLLIGQFAYLDLSSRWASAADWIEACCWAAIEIRFGWMLGTIGDIPVHPLPLVGLIGLAMASMARSVGRWSDVVYMRDSIIESSGTRGLPTNWPQDNFGE